VSKLLGSAFYFPILINAGRRLTPRRSHSSPFIQFVHMTYLINPSSPHTHVGDFADDKAILASIVLNPKSQLASSYVHDHLHLLQTRYKEWEVKMNESKSIHYTFTVRQGVCQIARPSSLTINPFPLPNVYLRYLGINIDLRLTWSAHIKSKTRTLNDRLRLLQQFLTSENIKLYLLNYCCISYYNYY